ncbi:hypothetical protein B0H34DRAFT_338089 [Crassisporium funariophilum]|nr:hypothetical protein B0H34DRAFT_338089 [Crassisporium funariophilum]
MSRSVLVISLLGIYTHSTIARLEAIRYASLRELTIHQYQIVNLGLTNWRHQNRTSNTESEIPRPKLTATTRRRRHIRKMIGFPITIEASARRLSRGEGIGRKYIVWGGCM